MEVVGEASAAAATANDAALAPLSKAAALQRDAPPIPLTLSTLQKDNEALATSAQAVQLCQTDSSSFIAPAHRTTSARAIGAPAPIRSSAAEAAVELLSKN